MVARQQRLSGIRDEWQVPVLASHALRASPGSVSPAHVQAEIEEEPAAIVAAGAPWMVVSGSVGPFRGGSNCAKQSCRPWGAEAPQKH